MYLIIIFFFIVLFFYIFIKNFKKENFLDNTIQCYNKQYIKNKNNEMKKIYHRYIPYDYKESDNDFTNKYDDVKSNKFTANNYLKSLKIKKNIQNDFPLRKDLTTNFNCQRQYMTCTENHLPRIPIYNDPVIILKYKLNI